MPWGSWRVGYALDLLGFRSHYHGRLEIPNVGSRCEGAGDDDDDDNAGEMGFDDDNAWEMGSETLNRGAGGDAEPDAKKTTGGDAAPASVFVPPIVEPISAVGENTPPSPAALHHLPCTPLTDPSLASDPPRITFAHREYDEVPNTKGAIVPLDQMVHRSFEVGEMVALRSQVPPHLRSCSSFELLIACLWRYRTIAI